MWKRFAGKSIVEPQCKVRKEVRCVARCTWMSIVRLLYKEVHCGVAVQGSPLWSRSARKSNVVRAAHGSPLCGGSSEKSIVGALHGEVHCEAAVQRSPLWGCCKRNAIVGMRCNEVNRAAEKKCDSYIGGSIGHYVSPNMEAI